MAQIYFNPNVTTDIKARDVAQIPFKEGQFLMTSDTGSVYYDFADGRKRLTDIIELGTEAERQSILVPVDKFYYVKETGSLWRYNNGEWGEWPSGADVTEIISHLENTDNPHSTTAEQVGAVPESRTVNGKALSSDITLGASDVGADASGTASSIVSTHNSSSLAHSDIREAMNGKANASVQKSATLSSSGWSASSPYTQTLIISGVTAASNGDISLAQNASAAQRKAARLAVLSITGQSAGQLTITADGSKPTVDIPVMVTIIG